MKFAEMFVPAPFKASLKNLTPVPFKVVFAFICTPYILTLLLIIALFIHTLFLPESRYTEDFKIDCEIPETPVVDFLFRAFFTLSIACPFLIALTFFVNRWIKYSIALLLLVGVFCFVFGLILDF